jgi:Glycosyltransferase family 87
MTRLESIATGFEFGLLKWLQVLSAIFLIASQLVWFVVVFHDPSSRLTDYHHYDVFATAAASGLDPYALQISDADRIARTRWGLGWQALAVSPPSDFGGRLGGFYSPLFYFLFRPLTMLAPLTGAMVWFAASCVALDLSVVILSTLRTRRLIDPLICLLTACFGPVLQTLSGGQINALLLLTILIAFWGFERQRPSLVGAGFGLALLLRPVPAIPGLLGYLAWRRDLKSLGSIGLWLLALVFSTIPFVGLRSWGEYIIAVTVRGQRAVVDSYVEGVSVWTFANRIAPGDRSGAIALALSLTVALLIAYCLWRKKDPEWGLAASLVLAGLLLAAPGTWFHYLVLLLIPFAFLLRGFSPWPRNWHVSFSQWLVLASIALLELHALTWRVFESQPYLSSWGTLGLGLLSGVLVWEVLSPHSVAERLVLTAAQAPADD